MSGAAATNASGARAIPLIIYGARSYTAGELLRLLASHLNIAPAFVVSRSAEGAALETLQPHVAGCFSGVRSGNHDEARVWLKDHPGAAIALCVGSGEASAIVRELADADVLGDRALVDLSGDFRLATLDEYSRWYESEHAAPEFLGRFDYCIPELHRETSHSKLVSNPGCFATAVQFALAPALRSGLIKSDLHVFAVTGSSGSGATPKFNTHHPFRAHEFYAYKPLMHQHTPEILRGLGLAAGIAPAAAREGNLSLVVHSVPLVRGISVTAMFKLRDAVTREHFTAAYRDFAAKEPMVSYSKTPPTLAGVIGTNRVCLSTAVEGTSAVAFCAIDNLTRGASGQALQNLNRVLGLPETTGLMLPGLNPL